MQYCNRRKRNIQSAGVDTANISRNLSVRRRRTVLIVTEINEVKEHDTLTDNPEITEEQTGVQAEEETTENRKLTRRERRAKKIRDKYLNPIDIKYVGLFHTDTLEFLPGYAFYLAR